MLWTAVKGVFDAFDDHLGNEPARSIVRPSLSSGNVKRPLRLLEALHEGRMSYLIAIVSISLRLKLLVVVDGMAQERKVIAMDGVAKERKLMIMNGVAQSGSKPKKKYGVVSLRLV